MLIIHTVKSKDSIVLNSSTKTVDSLFSPIIAINFAFLEMNVALLLR